MNCDLKSLNHIFINRSVNFFNLPTTKMKVMWKYLMNCSASLGKHIQELLKLWTITFNTSLVCKWMGIRSEKQWTDDNKYVVVFIGVTVVAGVFQSIFCPILAKMMKIDQYSISLSQITLSQMDQRNRVRRSKPFENHSKWAKTGQ